MRINYRNVSLTRHKDRIRDRKIRLIDPLMSDPFFKRKQVIDLSGFDENRVERLIRKHDFTQLRRRHSLSNYFQRPLTDLILRGYRAEKLSKIFDYSPTTIRTEISRFNDHLILKNHSGHQINALLTKGIKPFCERVLQTFQGIVASDGNLSRPTSYENDPEQDLQEIYNSVQFLRDLQRSSKAEFDEITLERYFGARNILQNTKTAKFSLHVSKILEPWLRHLQYIFSLDNIGSGIRSDNTEKDSIYLSTDFTIELYDLYKKFYPHGKKIFPLDIKLTPLFLFHFFMGDGGFENNTVSLYTFRFTDDEQLHIQQLLRKVGINSNIRHKKGVDKPYIAITSKDNVRKFFQFITNIPPDDFFIAKKVYPWKFHSDLKKKDFYPDT
ncbi:MAG: LAGLIDADG family homing endonuclease [Promethearchaeota archaeon]